MRAAAPRGGVLAVWCCCVWWRRAKASDGRSNLPFSQSSRCLLSVHIYISFSVRRVSKARVPPAFFAPRVHCTHVNALPRDVRRRGFEIGID